MGQIFLRLLAVVAVFAAIVLIVGSLLPREFNFQVNEQFNADSAVVFEMINKPVNWKQWSTFSEDRIQGLVVEYGGESSGEGAVQKWQDSRGKGKMWITKSQPNSLIEYELKFDNFPVMYSSFEMDSVEGKTHVAWSSWGKLPPGPFYGYSALLFPGQMKYEYEQSLIRLKELVEIK